MAKRSRLGGTKFWLAILLSGWSTVALTASWSTINSGFGNSGVATPLPFTSYEVTSTVDHNDSAGHIYSLVATGADPHGSNGTFPGPYEIARRLSTGAIDTAGFGDSGIISSFTNNDLDASSSSEQIQLNTICIDPNTHYIVVAGRGDPTGAGNGSVQEIVVERLIPPAVGTGTASLDTTFNSSGAGSGTPGVVIIATQYKAEVQDCHVGGDSKVFVSGNDDPPGSNSNSPFGKTMVAKLTSSGTPDNFGSNGVAEWFVPSSSPYFTPEVSKFSPYNSNASSITDFLLSGDMTDTAEDNQESMLGAYNVCTGAPDPSFNGNGYLLNTTLSSVTYNEAFGAKILDSGGIATTLVLGNGSPPYTADLVTYPYPLAAAGSPSSTEPGSISLPTGYPQVNGGGGFDSAGNILLGLSGSSSNEETVTELDGQSNLGFTVGVPGSATCTIPAAAPAYSSIYTFSADNATTKVNTDGVSPGGLLLGINEAFYGTAYRGGTNGTGTVFSVTTAGALTVLHSFSAITGSYPSSPNTDGANPQAQLAQGPDGTLYGVTNQGGANGTGTVFSIPPGGTAVTALHSFAAYGASNADGANPQGLILGNDGNLYGTTSGGGANGSGTFFQITPSGALTVLHAFGGTGDGNSPSNLIQDNDGTFYGELQLGGTNNNGAIFSYQPNNGGNYSLIYNFTGMSSNSENADGAQPYGGLVKGPDGQFYGVAVFGGNAANGTAFKLTGSGSLTTLHSFSAPLSNGENVDSTEPYASLIVGPDGNLYSTNGSGGANGDGAIFRITPSGGFSTLYSFGAVNSSNENSSGAGGSYIIALGSDGNIYGANEFGGSNGTGTIFKLALGSLAPAPTVVIAANPSTVSVGQSTQLQWASSGATGNCTASNGWSGSEALSGTTSVTPSATGTATYALACSNSTGTSSNSATVTVIAQPMAPPNLTFTVGNGQVTLSWGSSAGATSYNVYESTSSGGEGTTPVQTGITGTSATITGLSDNTVYYFTVAAVNTNGAGGQSNEVAAEPEAPPSGLAAMNVGPGEVTLTWTGASGSPVTYNVYQSTTSGGEGTTPVITTGSTQTFVSGLTPGSTYYFTVAAVYNYTVNSQTAQETGTSSNEAKVVINVVPPAPVVTATAGNGLVTLSWPAAGSGDSAAASYNVYMGTVSGGESSTPVISGIAATSYIVSGLTNGTTYYFTVSSNNSAGTSPLSTQVSSTPFVQLAAPTGVTATAGNARVQVSWTAVSGATQYVIYDGTTPGGESGAPAGITTSTTAAVTSLTNGTKYYFTVKAYNSSSGYSPASIEASATPMAVPAAPTGVTATAGSGQVSLSWTAVSGATSYSVYEGTSSGGESATAAASGITGTGSVITGLSNGTKYYFTVKAVNSNGASAASAEVSATPVLTLTAPTGVTAVAGNARVQVSWTAVAGATQYVIYDGTTSGGESGAPAGITTSTTAAVTSLSNGTKYYFTVKAYNSTSGYSPASSEVSATPAAVPAAPTGVAATAGSAQVSLSWTAVSGATSYNVYEGTSSGGESATAAASGITGTSSVITGLSNGTKYYFTVKAVNSNGAGAASAEVSATPVLTLAAPTGVSAVAGNARVQVSWTAVSGATQYVIYDGTTSGGESGAPAGITTSTTAAVTSLTNGTKYYFTVKAYNSTSGYSSASTEVSATPVVGLAAPTGVGAVAGNARVQVSWTAVAGATEYVIYDATSSGAETGTPAGITTSTTAAITSLTNGTKYYFTVKAYNSTSGYSSASTEVSATPAVGLAAPTGVSAVAGNARVQVSWTAVAGATEYVIYDATSSGAETGTPAGITTATTAAVTSLTNGTKYYFTVKAYNSTSGYSSASTEVSATPEP